MAFNTLGAPNVQYLQTYSSFNNLISVIFRVLIGPYLNFAHWRHQHAVTPLESVLQLHKKWGKKLDMNFLHRQSLKIQFYVVKK